MKTARKRKRAKREAKKKPERRPYMLPCRCDACRKDMTTWPAHMVGSSGYSYECWLEMTEPDPVDEHGDRRRAISGADALEHGLSHCRSERITVIGRTYRDGCEGCGGLRASGQRYCLACGAAVARSLKQAKNIDRRQIAVILATRE